MEYVNEIWRPVKGYRDIYEVSNFGRVRSLNHFVYHSNGRHRIQKGRIIKTHKSKKGYILITLSKNKNRFHTGVHRLVAIAFIENKYNKPQVNHIDGNKSNNYYKNLEWCTNQENQVHAIKNKLINHNTCEDHHNSKLTNNQVKVIRALHETGFTNKELATEYDISETAMSNILRNKTYKN